VFGGGHDNLSAGFHSNGELRLCAFHYRTDRTKELTFRVGLGQNGGGGETGKIIIGPTRHVVRNTFRRMGGQGACGVGGGLWGENTIGGDLDC